MNLDSNFNIWKQGAVSEHEAGYSTLGQYPASKTGVFQTQEAEDVPDVQTFIQRKRFSAAKRRV